MSKKLVYIKDNIENTHYIYSNELEVEYSFIKCYEWLNNRYKSKYPDTVIDLRYTITDEKCEIFCEEEFIDKGWVWNSKDYKKRILYELTKISVFVTVEKTSVAIQTIEPIKNFQETQTETVISTKPQQISTFVQTTPITLPKIEYVENAQKTFLNNVYNQDTKNIDLFNYFDTGVNEIIPDFSKWYTNELEPVIANISKLNLGNEGYSPNPFSPINPKNPFLPYTINVDQKESDTIASDTATSDTITTEKDIISCYQAITDELKGRLTQVNYGLRSKKYD